MWVKSLRLVALGFEILVRVSTGLADPYGHMRLNWGNLLGVRLRGTTQEPLSGAFPVPNEQNADAYAERSSLQAFTVQIVTRNFKALVAVGTLKPKTQTCSIRYSPP